MESGGGTVVDMRVGMGVGKCWMICRIQFVLVFCPKRPWPCRALCRRRTGDLRKVERRYDGVDSLLEFTAV